MVLDNWDAPFDLPLPKDNIERGERISTFWQVYNVDRCWSVILRRPATLPDSDHPWASITTPWPQRTEDYENVSDHLNTFIVRGNLDVPVECRASLTLAGDPQPSAHFLFNRRNQPP